MQIRRTADASQQSAAVQFGGDRHRVSGLPAPVQIQDRVVDVLVRRPIEVAWPQPFQHIGDGVLAQQHPAQHRLLGGHILRRLTAEVFTGRWTIHAGMRQIVDDRHGLPPPPTQALERTFDSRCSEPTSGLRHPPLRSTGIASRRDEGKRCWRVGQGAVVHEAVHRVCISVDTCVEWAVENLWINSRRCDISAVKRHTTRDISCGQESLRRVGPGYCAGRVGFRPDFG